jgi:DNA-binding NarL/FixJ family response regulator
MVDPVAGKAVSERVLRVVLVDDHPIVREGLRFLVNSEPDMEVVGEASNGEEAYRLAGELSPDVLVMDLSMPVVDGAEATERVRRDCPNVRVLCLTVHEERLYVTQLFRAGASGFVLKRAAAAELVRAVRTVAGGGTYIDPSIASAAVDRYLDDATKYESPGRKALSEREQAVLVRVAVGFSNKEIAAALGLSVKTVETYKTRAAEKLGLRTRVDIVRHAFRHGWLDNPPESNRQ